LSLTDYLTEPQEPDQALAFPTSLSLSSEHLDKKGVLLLENGQDMWLWFGKNVNPDLLRDLFGLVTLDNVETSAVR
jgi:protein transport protein SEC24